MPGSRYMFAAAFGGLIASMFVGRFDNIHVSVEAVTADVSSRATQALEGIAPTADLNLDLNGSENENEIQDDSGSLNDEEEEDEEDDVDELNDQGIEIALDETLTITSILAEKEEHEDEEFDKEGDTAKP